MIFLFPLNILSAISSGNDLIAFLFDAARRRALRWRCRAELFTLQKFPGTLRDLPFLAEILPYHHHRRLHEAFLDDANIMKILTKSHADGEIFLMLGSDHSFGQYNWYHLSPHTVAMRVKQRRLLRLEYLRNTTRVPAEEVAQTIGFHSIPSREFRALISLRFRNAFLQLKETQHSAFWVGWWLLHILILLRAKITKFEDILRGICYFWGFGIAPLLTEGWLPDILPTTKHAPEVL